ncbi:DUF2892 domain-containing protein [Bradyrhizobium sp. U87765 SZCCT0131]|uniref:YgaP-like transmembrane domain n=1 Tax=unclassified Bradyrhizobium TaxID=2631580 RepID=UPI001BAC1879|nr:MULTISPECIES: YgaP-like transmembrane domain [unclassified Bradyrhizobium]MBR1222282.1 DUF2892 domain-containing protein [Bradyrhizobium sp. U87765 SZCCT0131]MBR1264234.1 DUF2892 domain-containing protein [Bradyrhizobium sp. U87765 SZCCT0134]MBR1307983.1 DUF2892 domain-containing protein [Bradyrhizobium sp. U87765 SZCCT0110]MBR1320484.1 DUF2892 domain-containing protein [Bradyrhizobium sp. U87765 SZCCT0109]MBR1348403.1 DUF2892 domain-containing protein [Bradyrhizobium sp. U87765 SZCCT0048]
MIDLKNIHLKNLRARECWSRAALGLALIACAVTAAWGGALGWALLAAGATALLTAFLGFCPVCAMVGRRPQP